LKRLFDGFAATAACFLLLPVFWVISWMIHKEDGGPVFYRGWRTGRNGVPFRMFKFRTMIVNADRVGGSSTADDDPRITRMGKKLRKWKLDEIPQLLNVVSGDMSLVGPRPEVQEYTDLFSPEERRILSVRPGITDWASLWNRDEGALLKGTDDPDRFYVEHIRPTKLKLQLKYVQDRSFTVDLKIIALTIRALFV